MNMTLYPTVLSKTRILAASLCCALLFTIGAGALAVNLSGCAVQSSKAPQIDSKTATALNVGTNLAQLNKDYTTFFTDVGTAQRAGTLSASQVATLNGIGHQMKTALDAANKVFQTYSATYDQGAAAQIQGYLLDAAQFYAQLITNRTQMLSGK
jgi:hypothetical protein